MSNDDDMNQQLILIAGQSATGKSASLRNLPNQEKWFYANTESGKRLPFKNSFRTAIVDDPYMIFDLFEYGKQNPTECEGIIIDSLTYLMDMFESKYVLTAANTMQAWSEYQQYFKKIMQGYVATFGKPVIFTAHTLDVFDEASGLFKTSVPVKGALKNAGIESYFSTVVGTKKVPMKELKDYKNSMLNITDEDTILGFKYVFQTRITKATTGERIRSPMGMFDISQTYIDNDVNVLLNHLKEFYS